MAKYERGRSLDEKFNDNIIKHAEPPGCWEWTAEITHDGYGRFALGHREKASAHRWSYERFVGPIPDGLTIDHLCLRMPGGLGPRCVRPDHLEPVTIRENIVERGVTALGARNAKATHCVNGHEFTPENTNHYLRDGRPRRACRACLAANSAAYEKRNAEKRRWCNRKHQ